MSPEDAPYETFLKEAQTLHDRKSRKLAEISAITCAEAAVSLEQDENPVSIDCRKEKDRKFEDSSVRALIDHLAHKVNSLANRCDENDLNYSKVVKGNRDLEQKQATSAKALEASLAQMKETLMTKLADQDKAQAKMVEESIEQVVLTEKKIGHQVANFAAEELIERNKLCNEVSNLQNQMKDMQKKLEDEHDKITGQLQRLSAKLALQISDISDLVGTERISTDRALKQAKKEFQHQNKEIRDFLTEKSEQVTEDALGARTQLVSLMDGLQKGLTERENKQKELIQQEAERAQSDLAELSRKIVQVETGCGRDIAVVAREQTMSVISLQNDLREEVSKREQQKDSLLSEIAQQTIRRERDETAIIHTLEQLTRKVNMMEHSRKA